MEKIDLTLVPFDDLIEELESRSVCFIAAWETHKDKDKDLWFKYGKGTWHQAVRLSSVLNNDVLNNWNNEQKKLQKLVEDM